MAGKDYVYVESFGLVYRFTPKRWRVFLTLISTGMEVDYARYSKCVCVISHNRFSLNREEATDLLKQLDSKS